MAPFRVSIVAKDPDADPDHAEPFTYQGAVDDREAADQRLRVSRERYPARAYDATIEELVIAGEGDDAAGVWTPVAELDADDGGDS